MTPSRSFSPRSFSLRIGAVLGAAAAVILAATWLVAMSAAEAQQQQQQRTAQPAAPAAPAAPTGPVKTETQRFDSWILTCQELPPAAGAKTAKKTCWATMRVTDAKTNRAVLVLKVGRDGKDVPTLAITTPTGVIVREGVDITLGQNVRRLAFQTCGQAECEASIAYDQAFANDLSAAKEATVGFYLADGRQVNVKVAIVGIDKVLAALKKA
ncbi:invasion associated locus B family protein [Xanthobacter oligotrophicus]|uniref:invasion associated locus B family protein n=1 Tax=Xanthobacter oligotrophicus TaxID=2607286 RepID=UPI00165EB20F|nr:invasion associated locus B family protein [Xanthobacter oligotrophicus]MCG5236750.1 invasion associated locus B family protein [Xanthobacter oligotrophicus]